jgi:hypothetical protein
MRKTQIQAARTFANGKNSLRDDSGSANNLWCRKKAFAFTTQPPVAISGLVNGSVDCDADQY